jgi:hypothetical protein
MARTFVKTSSQSLVNLNAVATAVPITIAAWFNAVDFTNRVNIAGIFNSGNTRDEWSLGLQLTTGKILATVGVNGLGTTDAVSTTAPTTGTWAHGAAVFSASNARAAYLNGASKGTDTNSGTPTGADTTRISWNVVSPGTQYFNGQIAEVAIWTAALNDAEIAALASGIAPPYIRPASLVGYWPIWGLHSPEIDLTANNRQMTLNNAPAYANHAPVSPFNGRRWGTLPQAAAVLFRRNQYLRTGSRGAMGGI